jgi:hypothetical protein
VRNGLSRGFDCLRGPFLDDNVDVFRLFMLVVLASLKNSPSRKPSSEARLFGTRSSAQDFAQTAHEIVIAFLGVYRIHTVERISVPCMCPLPSSTLWDVGNTSFRSKRKGPGV